jgi:protocatechuate 3,4-dioxygenase beta subunit
MNRRDFLRASAWAATVPVTLSVSGAWFARTALAACTALVRTHAQTEGPYYKRNPPQRASLREPGLGGTPLRVTGRVLDADCRPVSGARLDFWHADGAGEYDLDGYRLRGYQITDANGRYALDTILPGVYTGRTRHLHVKITPPGRSTLTTQLYFPAEPQNAQDDLFDPALLMKVAQVGEERRGEYDFSVVA